jgi:hypothetical protein
MKRNNKDAIEQLSANSEQLSEVESHFDFGFWILDFGLILLVSLVSLVFKSLQESSRVSLVFKSLQESPLSSEGHSLVTGH